MTVPRCAVLFAISSKPQRPYKVCDAVDNDASAIHKAKENQCDLVLLHVTPPLQDVLLTMSVVRSKFVKIVGFSAS